MLIQCLSLENSSEMGMFDAQSSDTVMETKSDMNGMGLAQLYEKNSGLDARSSNHGISAESDLYSPSKQTQHTIQAY